MNSWGMTDKILQVQDMYFSQNLINELKLKLIVSAEFTAWRK
jgi:hypothetical protein